MRCVGYGGEQRNRNFATLARGHGRMFKLRGLEFCGRGSVVGEDARESIQKELLLGNLDAKRDWGYAPEYTELTWRILQKDRADDYVCATGETHTVREFCEAAFSAVGIDLEFSGTGVDEVGCNQESGEVLIRVAPRYYRPTEVDLLVGDASKAREALGWRPEVTFEGLVDLMARADWELAKKEVG